MPYHNIVILLLFYHQELAQAEKCFRDALEKDIINQHSVMQKLGLVLYRQGKLAVSLICVAKIISDLLMLSFADLCLRRFLEDIHLYDDLLGNCRSCL